eukprot:c6167_g1_i1.p1 GENE.c6167_g1_i1~~c6167_g1_i1.p1  ORF type:complete len:209 (-),score=59.08 c6167_g1_i1:332-886(-)
MSSTKSKRSFDSMMDCGPSPHISSTLTPCVEHRVSFLNSPTPTNANKRPFASPSPHMHQSSALARQHSPFLNRPSDITSEEIEKMFSHPKRARLASAMFDSDDDEPATSSKPAQQQKQPQEQKFTKDEVKLILDKALREMESKLREQYDSILQEQLSEQFQNFTRFNDDYVSRRLRASTFEYVS